ncbi:MAG TPA: homoserine dehydrogenase [Candidatus Methanomethylophilaceae archaeon]|nr:homoserine dehydrogenase [Candidatus Methanomethylophilaceae archaeon]
MRIFITGFGTVGQGVAEVIHSRRDLFKERYGDDVRIVGVMDSTTYVTDSKGLAPLDLVKRKNEKKKVGDKTYTNALDVLDSIDYDILIEVSPTDYDTGGQGLKNIVHALENKKDVITTNKGPLAIKFGELISLAKKNKCKLKFEGTVAGAMPIINLCHDNLTGEKISSIRGILNGTCNYILSKMDNGQPFDQALKEAQQLGYAETDPSGDVEGFDSACKVVILANSVFKRNVTLSDVSITGITGITEEAIALAKSRNMVIRLIGDVGEKSLEVAPRLIPRSHPLAVTGTLNAAQIQCDLAGPITVTGRGAGRLETASAVLSDLISVMDDRRD